MPAMVCSSKRWVEVEEVEVEVEEEVSEEVSGEVSEEVEEEVEEEVSEEVSEEVAEADEGRRAPKVIDAMSCIICVAVALCLLTLHQRPKLPLRPSKEPLQPTIT